MAKKTAAQKTWTPQALQALAAAWLGKGNAPTQEMIDAGAVQQVANPPAAPFLTGQQMQAQADAQSQHDQAVQDLQDQLAAAQLNAKYTQKAIEKSRVQGVSNSQDDAAARGIFQSSIKDGQIYDINAQAATQQQQLTDQLNALQTSVNARVNLLDEALRRSTEAFTTMGVENASQINTGFHYDPIQSSSAAAPAVPQPQQAQARKPAQRQSVQYRSNAYGGYQSPMGRYKVRL